MSKIEGSTEKSMITMWSLMSERFERPEKVLICRSHITTAFAEQHLVIGAMIDGSLALWDLNEVSNSYKEITIDNQMFVLRTPSYNSALTAREHDCPVITIKQLTLSESNEESIHFVTVDENGILIIWAINEVKEEINDLDYGHWMSAKRLVKLLLRNR
ncbi:unnamed protein product [Oppiella nova]|uniref:Uncharacterized protein n=1 Tax=Oppiella nova TaxID=334625 RepID=A0A7R9MFZ2_9ACAR|nr:unnamed protein product [Oppiella nova]CAG2176505.1 unnamed protein product [Oppiella nova]